MASAFFCMHNFFLIQLFYFFQSSPTRELRSQPNVVPGCLSSEGIKRKGDFVFQTGHVIEIVTKLFLVVQNATGKPPHVNIATELLLAIITIMICHFLIKPDSCRWREVQSVFLYDKLILIASGLLYAHCMTGPGCHYLVLLSERKRGKREVREM